MQLDLDCNELDELPEGLAGFTGLRDLHFMDDPGPAWPSRASLILSHTWAALHRLTALRTEGCWPDKEFAQVDTLPPDLLPELSAYTNLVVLHAPQCTLLLEALVPLPALSDLICRHMEMPSSLRCPGQTFPQLESLVVQGFTISDDGDPQALAYTLPHIQKLRLHSGPTSLEVCKPDQLWPEGPTSQHLHLQSLQTDNLHALLAQAAVSLRKLLLQAPPENAAEDAAPILSLLPIPYPLLPSCLRMLHLDGVGGEDFESMSGQIFWPFLQRIYLENLPRLRDASMWVVARCGKLRRVKLIRCHAITRHGIAVLMSNLSIWHIHVERCDSIGLECIKGLHRDYEAPFRTLCYEDQNGLQF